MCKKDIDGAPFCLKCSYAELMIPIRDGKRAERVSRMRQKLKDRYQWSAKGADQMSPDEVEDAYDKVMLAEASVQRMSQDVKYPLYASSELDRPTKWVTLATIDLSHGGAFIKNEKLKPHVPAVLEYFAALVKYDGDDVKRTSWKKDRALHSVLPSMILDFAANSRVDDGHHMHERCLRHGCDPRMKSMFYNSADIILLDDGSVGLKITSKVPASMNSVFYDTTTVATAKDILAVKCSCKVGAAIDTKEADDCAVCVHNPVLLYKLTQLMHEGLADHLLHQITSCLESFTSWTPA